MCADQNAPQWGHCGGDVQCGAGSSSTASTTGMVSGKGSAADAQGQAVAKAVAGASPSEVWVLVDIKSQTGTEVILDLTKLPAGAKHVKPGKHTNRRPRFLDSSSFDLPPPRPMGCECGGASETGLTAVVTKLTPKIGPKMELCSTGPSLCGTRGTTRRTRAATRPASPSRAAPRPAPSTTPRAGCRATLSRPRSRVASAPVSRRKSAEPATGGVAAPSEAAAVVCMLRGRKLKNVSMYPPARPAAASPTRDS